jgi:hypothetical protein
MRGDQLTIQFTELLSAELNSYGVGVERAFFADFTKCNVIRVYGEQSQGTVPLELSNDTLK